MCGIAGYLDATRRSGPGELDRTVRGMADTLRRRGPDDGGAWVDAEAGVALAHRRLAIVDLSPLGSQPMHSACGRYTISFNGEIYNHARLRRELEQSGIRFRGRSDTEVMLAAIAEYGLDGALERFNGMFAFALWDNDERKLELVRDRLGEKPLYYGWAGSTFLFGSELKALRAHPAFRSEIDREGLSLLLRYGYVPAPYSIYQGILKLPPAHRLRVSPHPGAPAEPRSYWSAKDVVERGARNRFDGSEEEAVAELDALLRDSVAMRMVADVPLGAFLSGGIDSSAVVALMQAQSTEPVKTFTIGFREPRYDEAARARAVALHLRTEHTEMYVSGQEAMEVIPHLPCLYDEPLADSSQIPTYLVSRLARSAVTVSLSGDGGDEIFGGYGRYFRARRMWDALSWTPAALRGPAARLVDALRFRNGHERHPWLGAMLSENFKSRVDRKLGRLGSCLAIADPDGIYMDLVSCWPEPSSVLLGDPGSLPAGGGQAGRPAPIQAHLFEKMMYVDTLTYLPGDILAKVDRATMGVSLESRIPFLDHRVVEFAWRLPLSMRIKGSVGKYILRKILYRYVPKELVERPKKGFSVPIGDWMRGPLRPWAEQLLDERRLKSEGFFDSAVIREAWDRHLCGVEGWQNRLWTVLVFQSWLETQ